MFLHTHKTRFFQIMQYGFTPLLTPQQYIILERPVYENISSKLAVPPVDVGEAINAENSNAIISIF